MEDEKTVEIVIPVKPKVTSNTGNQVSAQTTNAVTSSNGSSRAQSQAHSLALHVKWTDAMKQEISEDWTLRLLAVVTILALSLLVL